MCSVLTLSPSNFSLPEAAPLGTEGWLTGSQVTAHPASHYQAWARVGVFEESTPLPTHYSQQPQHRVEERNRGKRPLRGELSLDQVTEKDLVGAGALGRAQIKEMSPWPVPQSGLPHFTVLTGQL